MRHDSWIDGLLALAVTAFVAAAAHAADIQPEEVSVNLGGPRQAKAVLTVTDSDYTIAVQMLPVKSFDKGTNAQLNRDKARFLALRALAQHLADKPKVHLIVTGAQVTKAELAGKIYTLTLRVARRGVSVVLSEGKGKETDKPVAKEASERVFSGTSFLTRKQDYLDTLDQLGLVWDNALKAAQRMALKEDAGTRFYTSIAELEERGQTNLDKLSAEINDDSLLLQIEKDELLQSVGAHRKRMLASLKAAVLNFESAKKKEKKP